MPWGWDDWRTKLQIGYERLVDTLWRTAREFDVRGYGLVLREKLTTKWCDCGCSTDNLGEVCERTVREDEEEAGKREGKEREWDGRGSGVWGWESEEEEDGGDGDIDDEDLDDESGAPKTNRHRQRTRAVDAGEFHVGLTGINDNSPTWT